MHRDRSVRWVLVPATARNDEDGRFAGAFALFTDITGSKRIEEVTRRHTGQLASVNRETHLYLDILALGGMRSVEDPLMLFFFAYPFVLSFAAAIVFDQVKDALKGARQAAKGQPSVRHSSGSTWCPTSSSPSRR